MLKDPECAPRYAEPARAVDPAPIETPQALSPQSLAASLVDSQAITPTREQLQELQSVLAKVPQLNLPPAHYFAPGMYGRELFIPADTYAVGKIHRHAHIVMLASGEATINTDKGMERIVGPKIWVSPAGAKRALRTHTDCTFFTCHATSETDLEKLEAEIIEPEPSPFLPKAPEVLP